MSIVHAISTLDLWGRFSSVVLHEDVRRYLDKVLTGGSVDLTSPAEVGILLELLRLASENPYIYVMRVDADRQWPVNRSTWWQIFRGPNVPDGWWGHTEGETIAAALVAIAEGL